MSVEGRPRSFSAASTVDGAGGAQLPLRRCPKKAIVAAKSAGNQGNVGIKLFTAIYDDATLLPHLLRHYARAGIAEFYIAVAPELKDTANRFSRPYDAVLYEGFDVTDSLFGGTSAVTVMRRLHQGENEWAVIVDLDEFIEFQEDIQKVLSVADGEGANVIRGVLFDRFSADGSLIDVPEDADLHRLYPIKARFTRHVRGGVDHKGALVKGHLKAMIGASHHRYCNEILCSEILEISHFKLIGGSIERMRISYQKIEQAGIEWGIGYKRILDHYEKYGRFAWETFGGQRCEDYVPKLEDACTDCLAPITEAEYQYSLAHFGKVLCRAHQRNYAQTPQAERSTPQSQPK